MTLRKRIDRLTIKNGGGADGPSIVFLCEAGGETHVALVKGGGNLTREPHETEAAFMARALRLPGNESVTLTTVSPILPPFTR